MELRGGAANAENRNQASKRNVEGAMADSESVKQAQSFLRGENLQFDIAKALWKRLKTEDQLPLARRVIQRMRTKPERVIGGVPNDEKDTLWREEALLTSKDPELPAVTRHDDALKLLGERFDYIGNEASTVGGKSYTRGDTLGIAGGICKRRWNDLGRLEDLLRAAAFYRRGAECDMGNDAYPHINAAFVEDLLAEAGDEPEKCRARATALRERILRELAPDNSNWWNVATRAEAWFGLKRYAEATQVVAQFQGGPGREPWQLRTMAEQLAQLAHLHEERPLEVESIRTFFATLLPGAEEAISALIIGKVGLALSGGGFRASYYHLGVLACLAERDVLRDVEVLSCVSGGSIVGACYWLKLRERMLRPEPLRREDYIKLVGELIAHFHAAVQKNVRAQVQPYIAAIAWRLLRGQKGVLDPESTALALEEQFYQPLWPHPGPILMDQLVFQPPDHDPVLTGSDSFNPAKHNWLRTHKVPALILNATTVNTGHAWHFTSTWMGESPWAIHAAADSVPRLQWSMYDQNAGWQIRLGRAVAASACVPTVFAPLHLGKYYKQENKDIDVTLVDGGVHDNQGTVSLLASDCNVILVSDACGQLMLEHTPPTGFSGLVRSTLRPSDTLMERVRLANFADLDARRRSGRLRGLMFLHMKAGLDADMLRLNFVRDAYDLQREPLSPSGVSKDFQQALAELRTDLDEFAPDEANGLMACGYRMASKALDEQLPKMQKVWKGGGADANWVFKGFLDDITSTENASGKRDQRLDALRAGNKVDFLRSSPSPTVRKVLPGWRKIRSFMRGHPGA
jgi:predicted acylesterase/phospholipase RssA